VEKPLGRTTEQCLELVRVLQRTGGKLQVGSMKRHDPGVRFAHQFVRDNVGPILSVAAVYRDTVFRPEMQQACLDPLHSSSTSIQPDVDPKADRESYNLTTQGAHLFDTIAYLGGRIAAVTAIRAHHEGNWSWHGLLEFADGGRGHFELTCKSCGDWCERYEVCGMHGSVQVDVSLPFYHRPAQVRAFDDRTKCWTQPLGSLSNAYANQIDAFAVSVLDNKPTNPDVLDGLVAVQILEAVQQSIKTGGRTEITSAVL
jgi:predicted dehydrogenase